MPQLRPSTYLILGLLLLLAYNLRTVLTPAATAALPWIATQPAALLLVLLGVIGWRATHPTMQIRNR
ncbi:hypothetical protein [Streptacidiphilus sp. PAMC 29251]